MKKSAYFFFLALLSQNLFAYEVRILDAIVKDKVVPGAEVILQKNGETSLKATTNAQGLANFAQPLKSTDNADVSLIVKKDGYSHLVAKCPCDGLTYALSPFMKKLDQVRVVLHWGHTPSDLDSHLTYAGNHVYFVKKTGDGANLDVDETRGFGPETITINQKKDGVKYLYAVHNYTEGDKKGSASISVDNKVKVFVYVGTTLVRTFVPPKNRVGNTWVVFGIGEHGDFVDINKFADFSDRSGVGDYLVQIIKSGDFNSVPDVSTDQKALANGLNKNGEKAYHAKNFEEAERLYLDAINNNPEHSQAYSNLGLLYQKMNKRAEAMWANQKAITLASGPTKNTVQASSHYNIGRLYEDESRHAEALKAYQEAQKLKKNSVYEAAIERMKTITSSKT